MIGDHGGFAHDDYNVMLHQDLLTLPGKRGGETALAAAGVVMWRQLAERPQAIALSEY